MKCRICGKDIKDKAFSLGEQPVSNNYVPMVCESEDKYPLDLFFCDICLFLQLDEVVKSSDIFCGEYPYFSSCSETWLRHCENYVNYMIDRFSMSSEEDFIMEAASNDGCLLKFFVDKGFKVLGVEPSSSTAQVAIEGGVPTDMEFLNTSYARRKFLNEEDKPRLIVANNVIAHNPSVKSFVCGMRDILKRDGIITIEFPHLSNLIKYKQFDTIYHEHYSYFSLKSIMELMSRCGLRVFDVQKLDTHGGSLRVFVMHINWNHEIMNDNIRRVSGEETDQGVRNKETYRRFSEEISNIKNETLSFLIEQKNLGKRVVAYGAPAKGNTFLNYCGIDSSLIEYTVDRSEYKVGKKLPGSHIPIYPVDKILADDPDYIFILPWNIKDEIIGFLGSDKAKFITAIPELNIT